MANALLLMIEDTFGYQGKYGYRLPDKRPLNRIKIIEFVHGTTN